MRDKLFSHKPKTNYKKLKPKFDFVYSQLKFDLQQVESNLSSTYVCTMFGKCTYNKRWKRFYCNFQLKMVKVERTPTLI